MHWLLCVVFVAVLSRSLVVEALPDGAPTQSCATLAPNHPANAARDSPGGFYLDTDLRVDNFVYLASQSYNVMLVGVEEVFCGFVIQARDTADGKLIGSFTNLPATAKLLDCGDPGQDSTITHTHRNDKNSVNVTWMAPSSNGIVEIRYSVVRGYSLNYYANLNAAEYPPPIQGCPPSIAPDAPESFYPLSFHYPVGCQPASCDYFVAMGPNPANNSYLDIHLEGSAQGWVAVGFSEDRKMTDVDMLACIAMDGGVVNVVDSWSTSPQNNTPDTTQEGVCPSLTQFSSGRISCRFSRLNSIVNTGQDLNLNGSYFLFFARRVDAQPGNNGVLNFSSAEIFMSPNRTFNPTRDNFTNTMSRGCPPPPSEYTVYPFSYGHPHSNYFIGARVNPTDNDYLDIRLVGIADGWVAIGFSHTSTMAESDVVGCKRDSLTDVVHVLDSWNPGPQGIHIANILDQNQNGVCTHETQFVNGQISCTFSRRISAESDRDLNLNADLFQLYGRSYNGGPNTTGFPFHQPHTPLVTATMVNVINGSSATVFPRAELLKAHGVLMILSWPVLVVAAIFFAAWMKPALPNGEWFQFHRAFMLTAVFLSTVGLILAFIANARSPIPGFILFCQEGTNTGHFGIGIAVFALQFVNPLLALCRCKPTSSKRWIYNLTHGTLIGLVTEFLALTNIGLGIALIESSCGTITSSTANSYRMLWIYIAFVVFLLIMQTSLFMLFTFIAYREKDPLARRRLAPSLWKFVLPGSTTDDEYSHPTEPVVNQIYDSDVFQYQNLSDHPPNKTANSPDQPKMRKVPSKDAPLRWVSLGVFSSVTIILMLFVIILICTTLP